MMRCFFKMRTRCNASARTHAGQIIYSYCDADNVRHLAALKELGVVVVPPTSKVLACGDKGVVHQKRKGYTPGYFLNFGSSSVCVNISISPESNLFTSYDSEYRILGLYCALAEYLRNSFSDYCIDQRLIKCFEASNSGRPFRC